MHNIKEVDVENIEACEAKLTPDGWVIPDWVKDLRAGIRPENLKEPVHPVYEVQTVEIWPSTVGKVHAVYCPTDMDSKDMLKILGTVILDGVETKIRTIERYATMRQRKGVLIGLVPE